MPLCCNKRTMHIHLYSVDQSQEPVDQSERTYTQSVMSVDQSQEPCREPPQASLPVDQDYHASEDFAQAHHVVVNLGVVVQVGI